jgi:uncharacterized caspase-like protein
LTPLFFDGLFNNMNNVTVLTSSKKDEPPLQLKDLHHGAFAEALLDALRGGADPEGRGVISVPDLAKGMDEGLETLTNGQQHLGLDLNFLNDVFLVSKGGPIGPAPTVPRNAMPGVLRVLAIGINHFGAKAGSLHLDYAVADAHDVADALLTSQKRAPGKVSLYGDVRPQYLKDDEAGRTEILEAMDRMATEMAASGTERDVAVILFSGHGEMIDDKYYLIPYGVDVATNTKMETTSLWVEEFADKVKHLAEHGKVLLLLDACHSGAVGPGGSSAILDASALRNAVNMDNVTILTSSRNRNELSYESRVWKHGAFTQAFLDALGGGARPDDQGMISMPDLAKAMDKDLDTLTKDQQHLGLHMNFLNDVFVSAK